MPRNDPAKAKVTLRSGLYTHVARAVLFFVVASASFSGYYQKWHFAEADMPGDDSWASIQAMLDGTAHRPSVSRRLLPDAANWLDRVTPETLKTRLAARQASDDKLIDAVAPSPAANDPQYAFRYLALYAETFLSALLAIFALYLVCRTASVAEPAATFAPVVLMLLLPCLMVGGGFLYDYAELAFFALAAAAALRRPWWWLIPITVLATWNKETFLLFLLTLYPLLRLRASRLAAAAQTACLCAISLAVLLPIRLHFAGNPGGGPWAWWQAQRQFYTPHNLLFATDETYGVRMLSACTLLPMALLLWTAVRAWKTLPPPMQRQAQLAAAINLPLYLLFCNPGELRNLSMLFVALLLVVAGNLQELCQRSSAGC